MCKFAVPVAARYVQFVCDETGSATCLEKLTISGCPIGKIPWPTQPNVAIPTNFFR